jgi:2-polyprenyl-6-methoxyphenol hydroxylase-like FAD-dependent oxidoreductase
MTSIALSPKPVLISGAGLAGLLLAQALLVHKIPFQIFERDSAGSARSQGYRIRISSPGVYAIRDTVPPARYARFREGATDNGAGTIHTIDALTGERKGEMDTPAGDVVVGADRAFVRNLLFEDVEERVQFGKRVTGYERTPDGVRALFADGTKSVEGSLLVGADGIHSRVSQQLTDGRYAVYDTGARMIHGHTAPSAFAHLGKGVFAIRDESREVGKVSIITNTLYDAPVFGWTMIGSPGVINAPNDDLSIMGEPAADLSLELTAKFADGLRPIFTEQVRANAGFWKMTTSSPDGVVPWESDPRVTLLGDAVHAMTPAGGVGAVTALRDASLLGKHGGWNEGATKEYEDQMRVYASDTVKGSHDRAAQMLGQKELTLTRII